MSIGKTLKLIKFVSWFELQRCMMKNKPLLTVIASHQEVLKRLLNVSSYLIEIASEEFAATMAALHPLIDVPVESASQSAVGCLHPAGAYFESIEAKNRAFFSRSGCDNDFGTNVLQTAPLFEFAMKKLPSASNDFDFAASLFKELASKAKKSEN